MSYQWFYNGGAISGATSSSYTILTVLGIDSGTYFVQVSNSGGTVTSSNAYLNVVPPPSITSQPQSETVNQGQNASFSVTASGSGSISYQWYFNGSSLGSAGTSSTLSLNNVGASRAGNYFVTVANTTGATTSSIVTLTVVSPPGIQSQPQSQTVTQGAGVSFSVTANGSSPLSYQWYFNGSAISGATSSLLALSNVQSNQAGPYAVLVSNSAGSIASSNAALTVNVPAAITAQPQSQTVLQGRSASFTVGASGTPALSYTWLFNGTNLSGAGNNSSITIANASTNNAGGYAVIVQNNWGSVTSSVVALTVLSPPTIITQPQSRIALSGQSVAFNVVASGASPLTYAWNFNGAPLPGANNSTLVLTNVSAAVAGAYTAVVANNSGSVTSAVATLTVPLSLSAANASGSPAVTSSGFSLQLAVPAGRTYVVLASSDLVNWTPICTNVSVTGCETFTDTGAANHPSRMYRVTLR